jgi:hypothetical protein
MKVFKRGLAFRFPSLSTPKHNMGDAHMFTQDMTTSIAPIGGRREEKIFSIVIKGADSDKAREVLNGFADYKSHEDTKLCCDAINAIGRSMFYRGQVSYLVYKDNDKLNTRYVTNNRLLKLPFYWLQFVPSVDRQHFGGRILFSRSKFSVSFSVIDNLFGRFVYKWKLFLLGDVNRGVAPPFFSNNPMSCRTPFSISLYARIRAVFSAVVTHKYSWTQRSSANEFITEYYLVHRYLKNRAYVANLRARIIKELNTLFKQLELDAKIVEEGLPTFESIMSLLENIKNGDAPMSIKLD